MHNLKDYQLRVLDSLQRYYEECQLLGDAAKAFSKITMDSFGEALTYRHVNKLPGIPYICLRVPTGGGKTLLACNSISITKNYLLNADKAVVLWLVPSNTILNQTYDALTQPSHPYRQSLEASVGSFSVLKISEALSVQPSTLNTGTTVIISTMQAIRIDDIEGRKVYESAGKLQGHFTSLPHEIIESIERRSDNSFIFSLANVLKIRRPIVIIDEAHNSRTNLSFETLARFNPASILELTATPDTRENPSNVLHSVSAAELRAEAMIKVPIRLETKLDWKELLSDAISIRNGLEKIAKIEYREQGEYIRPVMLIQAQPNRLDRDSITYDRIEECLIQDFNIPQKHIAVETGSRRDLDDVNIMDNTCDIRYVITVQALKEGWDCPYAYVLCSFAELTSSIAIEQILGRVLRLPKAKFKNRAELNMAYAFVLSNNFFYAANSLKDALVQNGFNKLDVKDLITKAPSLDTSWNLFNYDSTVQDDFILIDGEMDNSTISEEVYLDSIIINVTETPDLSNLNSSIVSKVKYESESNNIIFTGVMDENEKKELENCFLTPEGKKSVHEIYQLSQEKTLDSNLTPSERGELFSIPALAYSQGDLIEILEETHFLERKWDLTDFNPELTESEFPTERPRGQQGEIFISEKGIVESKFMTELHEQLSFFNNDTDWELSELIHWLDKTIPHADISPTESGIFISQAINYLIDERNIRTEQLVLDKYRLRSSLTTKIKNYRDEARNINYQSLLFDDDLVNNLTVSPDLCFTFDPRMYPYNTFYNGDHQFNKHYYPQIGEMNVRGEELICAQFIDSLTEVKYWVRNLSRRPNHSFWLQTSTDKFYPDFVCLLTDGRYFVIEYKGEDRWDNPDSREKRTLGELWEKRSGGSCLFVMPKGKDFEGVIRSKISKS